MNVGNNYYELDVDNLGWGWTDEMLEPVANDKIVITTDGSTVTAQMYRNGIKSESATAKCNPEDTFDFNVGAKLAFDRLMKKATTIKIEVGKKYKLKAWDEVEDHLTISRRSWDKITNMPITCTKVCYDETMGHFNYPGCFLGYYISTEAIECEWEDEPVKEPIVVNGFKVGDRVNYSGYNATVICIAFDDDIGIEFDEDCKYASHDCGLFPLKDGKSGKRGMCRWFNNNDSNLKHGEAIKYYNGKIVAITDGIDITKGKIYNVIDGQFKDDVGDLRPGSRKIKRFEDLDMLTKFIELVE
jgi:hypothetical protein